MVVVNKNKYLERKATKNGMRDWWFPSYNVRGQLCVQINQVILPKDFEGKKVRFRVEIFDGDDKQIFEKDGSGKKD